MTAFLAKNLVVAALRASELIVPLLRPSGAQGGTLGFVSSGRGLPHVLPHRGGGEGGARSGPCGAGAVGVMVIHHMQSPSELVSFTKPLGTRRLNQCSGQVSLCVSPSLLAPVGPPGHVASRTHRMCTRLVLVCFFASQSLEACHIADTPGRLSHAWPGKIRGARSASPSLLLSLQSALENALACPGGHGGASPLPSRRQDNAASKSSSFSGVHDMGMRHCFDSQNQY